MIDPLAMITAPRHSPLKLRDQYHTIALWIDAMGIDQLLRVPSNGSPKRGWFYERGKLNNFRLRVIHSDEFTIIVRVK